MGRKSKMKAHIKEAKEILSEMEAETAKLEEIADKLHTAAGVIIMRDQGKRTAEEVREDMEASRTMREASSAIREARDNIMRMTA